MSIVDSLLQRVGDNQRAREALEQQLGPRPATDGRDGPALPAFVFWAMALANMPLERQEELCFGEAFRCSAVARLDAVLAHYEERIVAAGRS